MQIMLYHRQAINRSNWFKPIKGDSPSTIQKLTNKLPAKTLFILDKIVWFICTARNAIIVIICLIMSWCLDPELHSCKTHPDDCVFSLTGSIQSGLPTFQPPPMFIFANSTRNGTFPDQDIGFGGYGHYGKREAEAEPEADAEATAAAEPGYGYYGHGYGHGYGYGYATPYAYGHYGYYGKRSADAEPGYGYYGRGYGGYHGGYGYGYGRGYYGKRSADAEPGYGYYGHGRGGYHGYGHGYGYGYYG